jgi:hypothetical protein
MSGKMKGVELVTGAARVGRAGGCIFVSCSRGVAELRPPDERTYIMEGEAPSEPGA